MYQDMNAYKMLITYFIYYPYLRGLNFIYYHKSCILVVEARKLNRDLIECRGELSED